MCKAKNKADVFSTQINTTFLYHLNIANIMDYFTTNYRKYYINPALKMHVSQTIHTIQTIYMYCRTSQVSDILTLLFNAAITSET